MLWHRHRYCLLISHGITDTFTSPQRVAVEVAVVYTALLSGAIWLGASASPKDSEVARIIKAVCNYFVYVQQARELRSNTSRSYIYTHEVVCLAPISV